LLHLYHIVTLAPNVKIIIIIRKSYMKQRDRKLANRSLKNSLSTNKNESDDSTIGANYHRHQILLAQVFDALFAVNVVTRIHVIVSVVVLAILMLEISPASLYFLVTLPFLSQSAIHPMVEACMIGKVRTAIVKCLRLSCNKICLPQLHF